MFSDNTILEAMNQFIILKERRWTTTPYNQQPQAVGWKLFIEHFIWKQGNPKFDGSLSLPKSLGGQFSKPFSNPATSKETKSVHGRLNLDGGWSSVVHASNVMQEFQNDLKRFHWALVTLNSWISTERMELGCNALSTSFNMSGG